MNRDGDVKEEFFRRYEEERDSQQRWDDEQQARLEELHNRPMLPDDEECDEFNDGNKTVGAQPSKMDAVGDSVILGLLGTTVLAVVALAVAGMVGSLSRWSDDT